MKPPDRITLDPAGVAYIRNLSVKALSVYHAVTFLGLPEDNVLQQYPGVEPEDLTAVRAYVPMMISCRDHDEITGRKILPKAALQHGRYYKGRCRNATVARWNAERNCFFHWRQKFGRIYVETIKYPTDEAEPWWDVFDVVEELTNPSFEIPFDADAEFHGNPGDLTMYNEEMWGKGRNKHTVDIEALLRMREGR